jgi:CIC family chloride channel protein
MTVSRRVKALARLWRARRRRAQMAALRLLLRLVPNERQRVFALTLVIGGVCGLTAVAFHLAIRFAEGLFIERALAAPGRTWVAWTILTPTLGGLAGGALLQYVVPQARGSGIPQVKVAYAVRGGRVPFKEAVGKFFVASLQIGSGASLGREGPTVQICAGVASALGRVAALSRDHMKRLLPVGAAAGIAAAFNAPVAAVTFTIEEVVGDLDQTVLSGIIVASALAAVVERGILGEHPVFELTQSYGLRHASSLIFYALLGLAAAAASVAFTESLLGLRAWFGRLRLLPAWTRPGVGGLVTGLLAVAALLWLKSGGVTGGGYETLAQALSGRLAVRVLLALCVMKLAATAFSYGSGGAGGIFAPSLFVGGMLGGAIGFLDIRLLHHEASEVGAFALVGMGAVFAGAVRAPMTSVLIIFEMTGNYGLILPLMLSNMTAYGLARRWRPVPVYEALLEQDGIYLPHRGRGASHALEQLRVGEAMTSEPVNIEGGLTAAEALERVVAYDFSAYPVVEDGGRFVGLVGEARLRRAVAGGEGGRAVATLADKGGHVFPDQRLVRAVVKMNQLGARQLAVVSREDGGRLVGLLTMSDVMRAQARAALDSGDIDRTVTPDAAGAGESGAR